MQNKNLTMQYKILTNTNLIIVYSSETEQKKEFETMHDISYHTV